MDQLFSDNISQEETPITHALAEIYEGDFRKVRLGQDLSDGPIGTDKLVDLLFDRQQELIETLALMERKINSLEMNK